MRWKDHCSANCLKTAAENWTIIADDLPGNPLLNQGSDHCVAAGGLS